MAFMDQFLLGLGISSALTEIAKMAAGRGQDPTRYLFGGTLYCLKKPFGAKFYNKIPPVGKVYYYNINSDIVYG
jgi:hypothetical protein